MNFSQLDIEHLKIEITKTPFFQILHRIFGHMIITTSFRYFIAMMITEVRWPWQALPVPFNITFVCSAIFPENIVQR